MRYPPTQAIVFHKTCEMFADEIKKSRVKRVRVLHTQIFGTSALVTIYRVARWETEFIHFRLGSFTNLYLTATVNEWRDMLIVPPRLTTL